MYELGDCIVNEIPLTDIFTKRRSIRRFQQKKIPYSLLKECVNTARLAPTAKNQQLLEFIIVTKEDLRKTVFSHLHWAGYLPSWTPNKKEQPMAYIIIALKKTDDLVYRYDVGIALAHIVLYAEAHNLGSCILKNIDYKEIKHVLNLSEGFMVDAVVALGYKKENPVVENDEHQKKYWLDENKVLHVPKRPLPSVLHDQTFS